ncbi:hypothetical protein KSB_91560 [Ktedonobacter robiniae]|uniref:Tetratricopeptide repeat protein n=2 Tax=Ktedonobacter robiniae TaxID=2778365 RepID=A0ABQ3V628_9CHLR|nr:hypothetical protein KSB_91560 [Ktedonobacter robiniae]
MLDQALLLDRTSNAVHDRWRYKALALQILGQPTEALASIDRALELDSNNAEAWLIKSETLPALGRLTEALDACAS